jgi:hypothetical protein
VDDLIFDRPGMQREPYGAITIERHREFQRRGLDLRVIVRGEDVTDRCRFVDDARQYAELYRVDEDGHKYRDEDGQAAVEVVTANIEIRAQPYTERVAKWPPITRP